VFVRTDGFELQLRVRLILKPWGLTSGVSITNTGGTNRTTHFAKFTAFSVRASSDLALPLANWPGITSGTFTINAATYLDPTATIALWRFYLITIP